MKKASQSVKLLRFFYRMKIIFEPLRVIKFLRIVKGNIFRYLLSKALHSNEFES